MHQVNLHIQPSKTLVINKINMLNHHFMRIPEKRVLLFALSPREAVFDCLLATGPNTKHPHFGLNLECQWVTTPPAVTQMYIIVVNP